MDLHIKQKNGKILGFSNVESYQILKDENEWVISIELKTQLLQNLRNIKTVATENCILWELKDTGWEEKATTMPKHRNAELVKDDVNTFIFQNR